LYVKTGEEIKRRRDGVGNRREDRKGDAEWARNIRTGAKGDKEGRQLVCFENVLLLRIYNVQ
jgi:hypothetical protein